MSESEDHADKILKSESHRSFATESWVRESEHRSQAFGRDHFALMSLC